MRMLIAVSGALLGFANSAIADCPIMGGPNPGGMLRVGYPIGVQNPSTPWNVYLGASTAQTYRVCYNSAGNTNSPEICDVEVHNESGKIATLAAQMGGVSECVDVDGKQIVVKAVQTPPKTCNATSLLVSYCRVTRD